MPRIHMKKCIIQPYLKSELEGINSRRYLVFRIDGVISKTKGTIYKMCTSAIIRVEDKCTTEKSKMEMLQKTWINSESQN